MKFFLNSSMKAYLRGLAEEFGESTNAIRLELNHLEEAGLLQSELEGNKKVYQANPSHPLFNDIRNLVLKHSGITQVIEEVIERAGEIYKVWIRGDFAIGKDSQIVEMVISGKCIDMDYFISLLHKAERLINREIRYSVIDPGEEIKYFSEDEKILLVWKK